MSPWLNEDVLHIIFSNLLRLPKDSDRVRSVYRSLAPLSYGRISLDEGSRHDLSSASLVCKDWRRAAQERLFSVLNLYGGDPPEEIQILRDWNKSDAEGLPCHAIMLEVCIDPRDPPQDVDWVYPMTERCPKLRTLGLAFDVYTYSPPLTITLPASINRNLTTFFLSCRKPKLDDNPTELITANPTISLDWNEFQQALMSMPSLEKLVVILPFEVGFSKAEQPLVGKELVPSFQLKHLEVHTWNFILASARYKWLVASSSSSLKTVIVHLEGVEAVLDCRESITRMRIIDADRWEIDRFKIPDSTLKAMSGFLSKCHHLTELTAHVEVLEVMFRASSLPSVSLERLMIGAIDYEFEEATWRAKYPKLFQELVGGPLASVADATSRRAWQKQIPNLKIVVLEVLSDFQLDDEEEEEDEYEDEYEGSFLNMMKNAAQARHIQFWREVHVEDWIHPAKSDALGLE